MARLVGFLLGRDGSTSKGPETADMCGAETGYKNAMQRKSVGNPPRNPIDSVAKS